MKNRLPYLAVAFALSAAPLSAEDAAAPAPKSPVPAYVLKKKSSFPDVPEDGRAPFWPIGWTKQDRSAATATGAAPPVPTVQLDESSIKVTSILVGSGSTPSLAVINGRAYGEGEFLRLPKSATAQPVRVRVQRIHDGTVILQNAEQTLVARLQRPQLAERRAEELLLDPDR